MYHKVLLGLGSNLAGGWGAPELALTRALRELQERGVHLTAVSRLASTQPVGPLPQPSYVNAAASGETVMDPGVLLALLKSLEHDAGRRPGPRWGPRPLDIDILDFDGIVLGWDAPHDPMQPAHLVLPHPELHKRSFVLEPLAEIAPTWRHPVLGKDARQLLAGLTAVS
jgi:2-amino-4-hydroxy-6-hydroxymethyldihydropteridine diphosphokinase